MNLDLETTEKVLDRAFRIQKLCVKNNMRDNEEFIKAVESIGKNSFGIGESFAYIHRTILTRRDFIFLRFSSNEAFNKTKERMLEKVRKKINNNDRVNE